MACKTTKLSLQQCLLKLVRWVLGYLSTICTIPFGKTDRCQIEIDVNMRSPDQPPLSPGISNPAPPGVKGIPGLGSVDNTAAEAGLMKFPHSGSMWVQSVLQLGPAVFISPVNDCPTCSDTVMLSDRLIYLLVSPPQV